MKLRMRHTPPPVIVAVALGAGSALLATSVGGSAKGARPPLARAENREPPELGTVAR
jgi:hypothetical protein